MTQGKLITIDSFPSSWVESRSLFIWLPPGYDTAKRYAVLYMHDGQMLFDSTTSWNGQEWQVDENVSRLIGNHSIREVIVVGIPNTGLFRNAEYFPQAILDSMPESLRNRIIHEWLNDRPLADHYLKFMVNELKPYIDSHYPTYPDRDHTFIMGASMGGLISLYAICEFPEIFRGAGCLSTHWPLLNPVSGDEKLMDEVPPYYQRYLVSHLPDPSDHLIYFDHGTEALDALYAPFQSKVDAIMRAKGFDGDHWLSRVFVGEDHSERAWAKRLEVPLTFLLGSKG